MSRTRLYDYDVVARVATEARNNDAPMSVAVADRYGIANRHAGVLISKARRAGRSIPPGDASVGTRGRTRAVADDTGRDREPVGTWADHAECRGMDPDLFFPARGDNHSMRAAKAVCATCLVRAECLAHAMVTHETFGVWGGLSERERRRLRPRRTVAA